MTIRRRLDIELPLTVVAALTSTAVLLSWLPLTQGTDPWVMQVLLGMLGVGVLGALLRRAGLPTWLSFLLQLVLAIGWTSYALTGSPLPIGGTFVELARGVSAALEAARTFVAPVPASAAPLDPVLLPAGMGIALLVDWLAVGLRRVSLAGLALLAAYMVPVGVLVNDAVSWWSFALAAAGFLALLHLQACDQLTRWGRRLGTPGSSSRLLLSGPFRTTMLAAGAASIALALLLPTLTPRLELSWFGGRGDGEGDITVSNPMVGMKRDLERGVDVPLVYLTTDDPSPTYLRMSVLTRFTEEEWSPGERSIPPDQDGTGALPPLPGVGPSVSRTEYDWTLRAADRLESTWLPLPENVARVDAPGPWRWDEVTRDFTSTEGEDFTTAGREWTATGTDLEYDTRALNRAGSAVTQVPSEYLDLPDEFPAEVRDLTREVTAEGTTKFERAVILQRWFREDGGFEYTTAVPSGSGTGDLVSFLTQGPEGRRGYCEQFASSMAAMARALNIPSRVAVGFLEPTNVGPRQWVYSAHDMHAWPELYFEGSGWVRFEPTPARRGTGAPSYTRIPFDRPAPDASASASAEASSDTASPGAAPSQPPRGLDQGQGAAEPERSTAGVWVRRALLAGGALALLVLAGLAPRLLRRRRSAARAGAGDAESAWSELRDTAVDLRLPWPEGTTPRATTVLMSEHFGDGSGDEERPRHAAALAPHAVEALQRIARAVERSRYARPGTDPGPVSWNDVVTCRDAWFSGAPPRARRRAEWWPRSVFVREQQARPPSSRVSGGSGAVDRVG
ncbi:DUF3488 and transglutaminase-like domain-containing protein [Nocardioides rotundus]|uniref:transglutaminase family protein n=1 Tax=Nocardioides rotundus TaxID=1774216 RepID=UPI001CBC3F4B|nr:DUF3488 and transglutaminase-like domain-containing protein [Nocardioides rotundus]UAL31000.1 DUF3488 and transglutaminase-like domain-containing protein [Nocardioides rotundus]